MEFAIKVDSTFGRLRLNKIDFLEFLIRDEINWVGQIIRNSFVLDWTILVMVVYCILCITTLMTSVSVLKKRKSQQGLLKYLFGNNILRKNWCWEWNNAGRLLKWIFFFISVNKFVFIKFLNWKLKKGWKGRKSRNFANRHRSYQFDDI